MKKEMPPETAVRKRSLSASLRFFFLMKRSLIAHVMQTKAGRSNMKASNIPGGLLLLKSSHFFWIYLYL